MFHQGKPIIRSDDKVSNEKDSKTNPLHSTVDTQRHSKVTPSSTRPSSQPTKQPMNRNPKQGKSRVPPPKKKPPPEARAEREGVATAKLVPTNSAKRSEDVSSATVPLVLEKVEKSRPTRGKATTVCGCFGIVHKPLTNCLYCGRISCSKEGYDFCPFCGYMVEDVMVGQE